MVAVYRPVPGGAIEVQNDRAVDGQANPAHHPIALLAVPRKNSVCDRHPIDVNVGRRFGDTPLLSCCISPWPERNTAHRRQMTWLMACDRTAIDAPGGITVTIRELGRALIAGGDRVIWLAGRLNDSLPEEGVHEGLMVYTFPAGRREGPVLLHHMQRSFRRLGRYLLSREQIDAAVVHQPVAGMSLGPLLRDHRVPAAYFFYAPWGAEYTIQAGRRTAGTRLAAALRHRVEARAVSRFERILVFSRISTDLLRSHHPHAPAPQQLTPGVDLERFRPAGDPAALRRRLGWPEQGLCLFTVRRLVPRMGLDLLLEAFALLTADHPTARLFIGGTGPLAEPLRTRAAELGLSRRVRFLGYVPDCDLAAAFAAADLVVMPTAHLEGLGLVTLEAMACGTPVAATPVGGNVELLTPFDPALLASETTSRALAMTLAPLLELGPPGLRALGDRAHRHVHQRYGWSRTAADLRRGFQLR